MIDHLRDLIDAGVSSFKIEGRAKSAYYVGVVTNAYRTALDAVLAGQEAPAWAKDELMTISHREYSTGFYYGREPLQQSYYEGGYVQDWEVSAVVERAENGRLYLSERNRFSVGDTLELLAPEKQPKSILVKEIYDEDNCLIDAARHPLMAISIPFRGTVPEGAMLRRKK